MRRKITSASGVYLHRGKARFRSAATNKDQCFTKATDGGIKLNKGISRRAVPLFGEDASVTVKTINVANKTFYKTT
jgi:hypothetical protein